MLANQPYRALVGDWKGSHPPGPWRTFLGEHTRFVHTPESRSRMETGLVAELRAAADRYPADRRLRQLIADLYAASDRFAELWDSGAVGRLVSSRKTLDHPQVGRVTMDCDVLSVAGSDLRIMIYTAEPGTPDAERLELLTVIGTQTLVG